MSVCIYDEALLAKLKSWTEKTQIQVLGIDETSRLFQVIADTTNDTPIKLPLIALSRQSGYEILNVNKKPLTYDGADLSTTYDKSLQLNAIPILINYQLDVYTRYLKEADSYMRELIFNIINHQNSPFFSRIKLIASSIFVTRTPACLISPVTYRF